MREYIFCSLILFGTYETQWNVATIYIVQHFYFFFYFLLGSALYMHTEMFYQITAHVHRAYMLRKSG